MNYSSSYFLSTNAALEFAQCDFSPLKLDALLDTSDIYGYWDGSKNYTFQVVLNTFFLCLALEHLKRSGDDLAFLLDSCYRLCLQAAWVVDELDEDFVQHLVKRSRCYDPEQSMEDQLIDVIESRLHKWKV